jgi:hypothetical protein
LKFSSKSDNPEIRSAIKPADKNLKHEIPKNRGYPKFKPPFAKAGFEEERGLANRNPRNGKPVFSWGASPEDRN